LHALATAPVAAATPVIAAHVNHGLHADSASWEANCRAAATRLGAEFLSQRVAVGHDGFGWEAAAREARYAWFGSLMRQGDWLLSAHHENDQAETLLLNLLRGSGPTGIAGMKAARKFSEGFLVRPLLGVSGADIRAYAELHELHWSDDPSNADTNLDRNYLRHEILPLLGARWPAVAARLRQSADLAAESSELLIELADIDLASSPSVARLDINSLANLAIPRLRNAIRQAVRRCGFAPLPASRLYQVVHELIPAKSDGQPLVAWPGGEIRRFRDHLHILSPQGFSAPPQDARLRPGSPLHLGADQGTLILRQCNAVGIAPSIAAKGLAIRYRQGGESIRLPNKSHHQKLKKLLQDEAIVPWMRDRLPLLYADERLIAVADLWMDAECDHDNGFTPQWIDRPPLY
jgi:tRNA(Ile)-lysidine synthase